MNQEEWEHYKAQESLTQQQIDSQSAMYAPQVYEQMQQQQAVLVEQTNPSKNVDKIMMVLKGIREDKYGNIKRVYPAKLNNTGLYAIEFWLNGLISNEIRFSTLDEKTIKQMMNSISDDLVDELRLNCYKWGIKNKTDLDSINDIILINIYACLKRAEGSGEKNWIGKISVENIGRSNLPQPKKEGFLSKFRLG